MTNEELQVGCWYKLRLEDCCIQGECEGVFVGYSYRKDEHSEPIITTEAPQEEDRPERATLALVFENCKLRLSEWTGVDFERSQ